MKKIFAIVIAVAMVLSLVTVPAIAETSKVVTPSEATMTLPRESTRDAANLNEALNVAGGSLNFTSEGEYPWVVDGDAAKSSNAGVHSSNSTVTTTATANEGDIVQFDFKAWGEGSSTYWDKCAFSVDGTEVFTKGAYDNEAWESFAYGLTAGSHTLTWTYSKDSSVNPTGDYFAVDNVYVGEPVAVSSIVVDNATVAAGRRTAVTYQVLPDEAFDKSVTFTTGNPAIATIDANGIITGVAEGTTTVTVTSAAVPTVSGTATVTVTEALPTVNLEGYDTYDIGNITDSMWVTFADYDPTNTVTALTGVQPTTFAAAFAGGNVYGYVYESSGADTRFYIMDTNTYSISYPGTDASNVGGVFAMAYNHANQTMYGICGSDARAVCTIDLATGGVTQGATITGMATSPMTLAIDMNGNAYSIALTSGDLYALDLNSGAATLIGATGVAMSYVQSMTYDFSTDMIYWAQILDGTNHGLYCVNPQTAAVEYLGMIGPSGGEVTGLYIKNDLSIDPIEVPNVTVTFVDGFNNAVISTMTVEAGTVLDESTFPTAPTHEGLIFTGWDYNGAAVYVDTTITARYQDPNATIWDFEQDPASQGFVFQDQDGDGNNWEWHYGADWADFNYHEGLGYMMSASYINYVGALTPDNWMITPVFTGNALSFWAAGQDASYCDEVLGIFVSTDNGSTWSSEIARFVLTGTDTQYNVNLSAYANMRTPIKVAIRHYDVTDMFQANVDYIEVMGGGDQPPVTPAPATPTPAPVTPEPGNDGLIAGYYFENQDDVNAWTFISNGDTEWVWSDNNPGGYDYTEFAHEGSRFIMSYSFIDYVGSFQADNWAISPAVTLPSGSARVSFYANQANASYPEAFDVYVGTTSDYTAMTLLQANVSPNTGYDDEWTHYEFDLSAYAGQTIYLAFYDHCYDMYEIWIDQVEFFGEGGQPPVTPTPVPVTPVPVTPVPVTPEPGTGDIWDFEQDPVAQGFTFVDQDGDGENWEWRYGSEWADFNYHEGMGYMMSASYINYVGALTPDNWMITPAFSGTGLTFWAQGQDASYADEYIGIFVSTDNGSTWSSQIAGFTLTGSDTQYTVDLSAYAGQTIKVAIRHYNVTDMFQANVDYIEVQGGGQPPVTGIIGDTTLDGQVTTADAILALRHIMGLETLTGQALEQADGNQDGNVTIEDCILILRAALGLIEL